jgi:hypothetical protein
LGLWIGVVATLAGGASLAKRRLRWEDVRGVARRRGKRMERRRRVEPTEEAKIGALVERAVS